MGSKPPRSRMGRLARIGRLSTRVSSSYLGQRIAGAFQDEETRRHKLRSLHLDNARRVADTMGQLKGAAMKMGQTMAMFADSRDLPPEIGQILSRLNDRGDPVPFDTIRSEIESQLERPLSELFQRVDPIPLGTASLAQAHAALLPDGTPVVVKVLHQGIEKNVSTDLAALKALMAGGRALGRNRGEMDALHDEIRLRLHEELDYYQEAANLEFFAPALAHLDGVVIPRTHPAWCTDRVLTMDRVPGVPITEFLRVATPEARQRAGERLVRTFYSMIMELRSLHADPHAGNYLFQPDGQIGLVDFGCVKRFEPAFVTDYARIGLAIIDEDRLQTMDIARRMGLLVGAGPDAEDVLWRFCLTITRPLRAHSYTCGSPEDNVLAQLKPLAPELMRHPQIRQPRELLYLHRTLGGVYAMLRKLQHTHDYRTLFSGYARHAIDVAEGHAPDRAPIA